MLLGAMLVLPLLPSAPPVLNAPAQLGIWLFMFWHAVVAIGAFVYVAVLRAGDRVPSRSFTMIAACSALGLVTCGFLAAFIFSDRLPPLANGTSLTAATRPFVMPT